MAFYIKVTKEVADALDLTAIRNKTADGNVLLWQADVAGFPGDTVFDRAVEVGGVCLTPQQAKTEIDGTDNPTEVSTPDKYKVEDPEESDNTEGEVTNEHSE
jgi:hypothetical protein